jgi:hypothetical protein
VTPNLCDESDLVAGPGDESAVAGERFVHDALATEARKGRLESGKFTPNPWLRHRGAIDWRRRRAAPAATALLSALSYRTQSWSISMATAAGLYW